MNPLLKLLQNPAASRLGETLLHFLWQGAAVAALLALILRLLRNSSANRRYAVSCTALALMAVLPLVTWQSLAPQIGSVTGSPIMPSAPVAAFPETHVPPFQATDLNWLPWLAVAWLAGVLLCALRLAGGWWQMKRLQTCDVTDLAGPWAARLLRLQSLLCLTRPVRLVESLRVTTPLVLGWLRPVILLPAGFVTSLSPAQVDAILAHELAHLRRHDFVVNLAQRFVETLLFYHPAVWWVSAQIRLEREHACDDLAAEALGSRRILADALVTLAEREAAPPALALGANGGSLSGRVRRLLGAPEPAGGFSGPALLLVGLLALGVGAGGLWLWQRYSRIKPPVVAPETVNPRKGLMILTNQLAELDLQIQAAQKQADMLRMELNISNDVAEGHPTPAADGLRQLLANRSAISTRLDENRVLLERLERKSPDELRLALNLQRPNPLLQSLLSDLQLLERQKAGLESDFAANHPDVLRINSLLQNINRQIDAVVQGMMDVLRTQVQADGEALKRLEERAESLQREEVETHLKLRPYQQAQAELESLSRMREAVLLKLTQEAVDVELRPHRNQEAAFR